MQFGLSYYILSLFFGGVIALISAFVVFYSNPKKLEYQSWFLLNISSAVWSFGYMAMVISPNRTLAYIANIVLHAGAIFIPVFYLFFIVSLVELFNSYRRTFFAWLFVALVFSLLNFTPYFITDVLPKHVFHFVPDAGSLYWLFTVYFFGVIIYALWILFKNMDITNPEETRRRHLIFFASLFGFAGGGSVFFLTFNVPIPPYAVAFYSLYPAITTYAILKHHLFDVKVITTELFTFALWIVLFSQILIAGSLREAFVAGTVFFVVFIFGIYLIRSVLKEVRQREKIESLALELSVANEELKKLDEAKSEFISIASHQLRAPLTVIKGYVSMLLEGSLGAVTDLARDSMKKVFISAEQLVRLIADMLDLSRIEGGRMRYDFKRVMMDDIVAEVTRELEHTAKSKGLAFLFENRNTAKSAVNADSDKMREVVMNLIDNAIKYTSAGRVSVELYPENKDGREWLALKVQDTGIGIKSADIGKMFTKFGRSEEARRLRADGLGLGLYVVKKIVEDHGGRVRAESPGLGHGSTFFVELPTAER